jgi:hypothetical protein
VGPRKCFQGGPHPLSAALAVSKYGSKTFNISLMCKYVINTVNTESYHFFITFAWKRHDNDKYYSYIIRLRLIELMNYYPWILTYYRFHFRNTSVYRRVPSAVAQFPTSQPTFTFLFTSTSRAELIRQAATFNAGKYTSRKICVDPLHPIMAFQPQGS